MTERDPREAGEPDPRTELAEIAGSARALLEWYDATGAAGLPGMPLPREGDRGARPRPQPPQTASVPVTASVPGSVSVSVPVPAPVSVSVSVAVPVPVPAPASAPVTATATAPPTVAAPASEPASADDRKMRLALLAEEVRACTKCGLAAKRTQTVFARGNPFAEICFVGEGPGADEDAQGFPFVGKAGQLLDRMIAAMGYGRDDVYVANIVKCRPPDNRKPEPEEMATCVPYLATQLGLVQPKVLVALGATAVQGLIGTTEGITRLRGKWKLYKGKIPIMPTFHPAYLLRQPAAKREVWSDLQEVMRHLGKAPPPRRG